LSDGGERHQEEEGGRDLDQEWSEMLEEHRLAMPGIQVLFAFLLILPFQQRFEQLTQTQVDIYFSALLCAAFAIILLITPTATHRIRWRQGDKEALLKLGTGTSIAATAFIAAGMTASIFLITDFLFGSLVTSVVTALVAASFVWFWYGLPVLRRARDRARHPGALGHGRAENGSRGR
jgi:Family of unknown function (DUF6328)